MSLETPVHEGGCSVPHSMEEGLVFASIDPWPARCEGRGAAGSSHREGKPPRCDLRRASPRWGASCKRQRQGGTLEASAGVDAQRFGREGHFDSLHLILGHYLDTTSNRLAGLCPLVGETQKGPIPEMGTALVERPTTFT